MFGMIADEKLANREGHMDGLHRMSIIEKIRVKNERARPLESLRLGVCLTVPEKIDDQVAKYALDVMSIRIDEMTEEQKHYQASS
ncbi:MAG TPA: hypothetical protein VGQ13_08310 [Nitrososphaera sp.]|jgi:S-adenosylhomocysteine hydrolase|nr:hypothetical protein [Nitrososphaera sp.]